MKNYKESLLAGVQAAKNAERQRQEIDSVIESINEQIKEFSSDKAGFGVVAFYRREESSAPESLFPTVAEMFNKYKTVSYLGLGILNHEGKKGIEIATWSKSDSGYPCTITFGGEKYFCSEKAELENVLNYLLKEVKTGEAILEQIRIYDKNHPTQDQNPTEHPKDHLE